MSLSAILTVTEPVANVYRLLCSCELCLSLQCID